MSNRNLTVENLKKVLLSIEAGTSPEIMDLTPTPIEMDFIFGIGCNGITPFEYELANKRPGDGCVVHVKRQSASVLFEHLTLPILKNIDAANDFYLNTSIRGVCTPENREIIKALAGKSGCGDGCDCGCGCD